MAKLKYRLTTCKNNKEVVQDLDLKGLYKQAVRKKWQKISGQPYQCKILDVQLNLTSQQEIHLNSSPNSSCHHTFGHLWFSKLLRLKVPFANNTTTLLKFFV
jgi:hypothetical protein